MDKKEILVITNPMIAANRSAEVTLSKFLRVMKPMANAIKVIGGNISVEKDIYDVEIISFPFLRFENKLRRLIAFTMLQMKMMKAILLHGKKKQPIYFWIADKMIFPFIVAKLKDMEVNYFIYGNVEKEGIKTNFSFVSGQLIRFMALHSDFVCMESSSVKNEWNDLNIRRYKIIHLYTEEITMSLCGCKEKRIGMVCRLAAGKHVLESIKAMDLIHKKYPDWKFEIIGSGVLQNECETLIGNLNAKDYIDIHGWVEHSDLHYVTRKWRYILFPTDTEGMPNALLELMGWGIPGIASSVGGIIDIIQDGSNGLIITDCSINEIYNGLYRAILIPENQYADMAQNAYETIADKFSLEAAKKDAIETLSIRKDQKV